MWEDCDIVLRCPTTCVGPPIVFLLSVRDRHTQKTVALVRHWGLSIIQYRFLLQNISNSEITHGVLCHIRLTSQNIVLNENVYSSHSNSMVGPLSLLQGELLSPCRCKGSVRCTHQPCLIRWISERGSWSCELCYFKYHVLAISTKNPLQVCLVTPPTPSFSRTYALARISP